MPNNDETQNARNTQRTDQDSAGQSSRPSRRPSNVNTSVAQQADVPSPRRSGRLAGEVPASTGLPDSPRRTRAPQDPPGSVSPAASISAAGAAANPSRDQGTTAPQQSQNAQAEQTTSPAPAGGAASPRQSRAQARYTPRAADSTSADETSTNASSDGTQANRFHNHRTTVGDADSQSEDSDPTPRASQTGLSNSGASISGASTSGNAPNPPTGGTADPAAAGFAEAPGSADSSHGFIPIARDTGDDVSMRDRSASGSRPASDANRFSPGAASTASANGFRAVSPRELSAGKAHFKYTSRRVQSSTACDVLFYQTWGHGARLMLRAENRSPHYLLCKASRWGPGALQEYRSYAGSEQIEVEELSSLRDKNHDRMSIGAVASLFSTNFAPTENAPVPWANEPYKLVLVSFDEGVSEHWYKYADLKRRWHTVANDVVEFLGYGSEARSTVQPTTPSTRPGTAQSYRPGDPTQETNSAGTSEARTTNAGSNGEVPENIANLLTNLQNMMATFITRISNLEASMNARRAAAQGIDQDAILFEQYGLHRMMRDQRTNETECPVCRNSFDGGTVTPLAFTNCSHAACERCTRTIILQNRDDPRCPMCRETLLRGDLA